MNEIVVASAEQATSRSHAEKCMRLEQAIKENLEPLELKEKHYFAHGTYTRELYIPAGTVLTGKIHRYNCINILSKGILKVTTDEREYALKAPYTFVSGAGTKKAIFAITDSIWINVHPWDGEPDLDAIEEHFIVPSYEALEQEQLLALEELE